MGCIICGGRGWADAIANILLYAPLGAALVWNGRAGLRSVGVAFLLSACIELAQTHIPGRDPSLGDVTFNTLGAAAGQVAALLAPRWLVADIRVSARLCLAAAAAATAVMALTGTLLAPAFPTSTSNLWFAPDFPDLAWYHARVLSAGLGGTALHPGPLPLPAGRFVTAGESLAITAIAGPPVPVLGPLLAVGHDWRDQLYLVGPDRDDLVLRYRTRAATWGLDQPDMRLRSAFATIARGDTIRIGISSLRDEWCMSLNRLERCGLGYTVADAWAMVLFPRHWPPWSYVLLGGLWVGALAFPVGLWTRRSIASLVALGLFGVALAIVPGPVGLLATPASAWSGAAVGWGAGVAVGVWRRSMSA